MWQKSGSVLPASLLTPPAFAKQGFWFFEIMTYQFDVSVAKKIGVEEAIILHNIGFWIAKNKANKQGFHEGRYWTYNTAAAFAEQFPFWTEKQIRRILDSLTATEVLVVGSFNKSPMDRTKWFSLSDKWDHLSEIAPPDPPFAQMGKSTCPNGQMQLPKWAALLPDSENTDKKRGERKRFTPPSLQQVKDRCGEIGLPETEAQRFIDFHAAAGWMLRRGIKMQEWTYALSTWKSKQQEWEARDASKKKKSEWQGC